MKKFLTRKTFLSLALVASSLVGCSEYDNGFDSKRMKFTQDFTKEFGTFDSKQDWNAAERATVTVITSSTKNIKVYSDQDGTFNLVGNFGSVQGEQVLEVDVEKSTTKYLIVSDGEHALRTTLNGVVNFDDLVASKTRLLSTRYSDVNFNEWDKKYIVPAPITDAERRKVVTEFSKPYYGAVNTVIVPWRRMFVQQVYKGDSEYKDGNGWSIGKGSDKMNNLHVYNQNVYGGDLGNNIGSHFDYVNNFSNGTNYTSYNNIVGMTLMREIDPVNVPVQRIKNVDGNDVDWVKQFAYLNNADSQYHAEYILRNIDGELYLGFDFYAKAPQGQEATNKNMNVERDWVFNDWILKLSKVSDAEVELTALENAPKSGWILAGEDLGGSNSDFDYNDVIVKVEHVANESKAKVTALAAGGTLASYVFFGDQCVGEIHQMLGAQPAASGAYKPINVEGSAYTSARRIVELNVDPNWTITMDNGINGTGNNMGGFSIRVLPAGTPAMSERLNSEDEVFNTSTVVNAPKTGSAPLVICVPFSYSFPDTPQVGQKTTKVWSWPGELIDISQAYFLFNSWTQNRRRNSQWYTDQDTKFTVSTDHFLSSSGQSPIQEMTQEEKKAAEEISRDMYAFDNATERKVPENVQTPTEQETTPQQETTPTNQETTPEQTTTPDKETETDVTPANGPTRLIQNSYYCSGKHIPADYFKGATKKITLRITTSSNVDYVQPRFYYIDVYTWVELVFYPTMYSSETREWTFTNKDDLEGLAKYGAYLQGNNPQHIQSAYIIVE